MGEAPRRQAWVWADPAERDVEEKLARAAAAVKPRIVVCIVPDEKGKNGEYLYPAIKNWSATKSGVPSQCAQVSKVASMGTSAQYLSGLLLKMNLKLRGENVHPSRPLLMDDTPTIVFGVDVNHAAPGSLRDSYAAVVASMDKNLACYYTMVSAQPSRQEIIHALEQKVKDAVANFHKLRKTHPRRIIFLRDGIGHEQFEVIGQEEIKCIRIALAQLSLDAAELVYIVVQKRTHCRLFSQANGGVENAPSGTVIDRDVTNLGYVNFFMVPQRGRIGTSRPVHFHVLRNDANLTVDQLQRFLFDTCHLTSRCTKITTSPAMVNFAHLAAFQAPYFVNNYKADNDAWEGGSTSSSDASVVHQPVKAEMMDVLYYV
mmetsp:Transcript_26975/g.40656  ORF Transcript_26975/g.40656 Transcript_26975/m.40656 type:complete len:373 (+) Transcript_26975:1-1119(+)